MSITHSFETGLRIRNISIENIEKYTLTKCIYTLKVTKNGLSKNTCTTETRLMYDKETHRLWSIYIVGYRLIGMCDILR